MARIGGFGVSNSKIYLNVYDLNESNDIYYPWGLGFYHSGLQVGREEYTFASSAGIFHHEPKGAPGAKFREAIELGEYKGTTRDLEVVIQNLRSKFPGNSYHVLNQNCNHFANELSLRLLGKEIPAYVNRMAYYGSFFSCLLPDSATGAAPVDNGKGSSSSDESSSSFSGGAYSGVGGGRNNGRAVSSSMVTTSAAASNVFAQPGRKLGGSSTTISRTNDDGSSSSLLGLQKR